MIRRNHVLTTLLMGLIVFGAALQASNIDKAIADAESRRRGAEDSLREIMAKADPQLAEARTSYTNAASSQNAWLDLVCQTTEGGSSAPDVTAASQAAATALMDWVAVGGRALGLPPLSDSLAKGLQKSVTQDLIDIGNATFKNYGGADDKKRAQAIASLKTRLHWKTPDELR